MNRRILPTFALLLALSSTACSSLSPGGLIAASRLDPLNTPPDRIAVAVGVPQAVRLSTGDAVLRIAFEGSGTASNMRVDEVVPLQFTEDVPGAPAASAGETVFVARLATEDAARFAVAQKRILAMRSQGVRGSGSLSVAITGGCHTGAAPSVLPVSTWLMTDPADGFMQLTRKADMFREMGSEAAALLRQKLPRC